MPESRDARIRWWTFTAPIVVALSLLATAATAAPRQGIGTAPAAESARPAQATDAVPGGEIYERGRTAVLRGRWEEAIDHLEEFLADHPDSSLADDAVYWVAHSLKQSARFAEAVDWANRLIEEHAGSPLVEDAEMLRVEAASELVRAGDTSYSRYLQGAAGVRQDAAASRQDAAATRGAGQADATGAGSADDDLRLYALNAMIGMGADNAWPMIQRIFEESDDARLRRRAVFALSQIEHPEALDLLLELARGDSDREVRKQALFWVGQQDDATDRIIPLLVEVATAGDEREFQESAIFALGQLDDRVALDALRQIVGDKSNDDEVRGKALFWISQRDDGGVDVLRQVVLDETENEELRGSALFGLSQIDDPAASEVLMQVARGDHAEELRGNAIFWLGQRDGAESMDLLVELWDEIDSAEIKGKLLFAFSQHDSEAATDKLIEIAKDPDEAQELKKNAIFWLGQRADDSEKARQALMEIAGIGGDQA